MVKTMLDINTIICLGAGASLSGFDFKLLNKFKNKIIISSNQMFLHYEDIRELVIIDYSFFEKYYDEILTYKQQYEKKHKERFTLHIPESFLYSMAHSRKIQERFLYLESMMPLSFFRVVEDYANHKVLYSGMEYELLPMFKPFTGGLSGLAMLSMALQMCENYNNFNLPCDVGSDLPYNVLLFGYDYSGGHCYNEQSILFPEEDDVIYYIDKTNKLLGQFNCSERYVFNVVNRKMLNKKHILHLQHLFLDELFNDEKKMQTEQ